MVTRSIRWRTWTRDTSIGHSITSLGNRTQPPPASWISWWTKISCWSSLPRGLWDQPRLTTSRDFRQLPRTTWCHLKKNGLLRIRMFRQRWPCRFFEASDTMCFSFVNVRQVGQWQVVTPVGSRETPLKYTLLSRQSYNSKNCTTFTNMMTAWFLGKCWHSLLWIYEVMSPGLHQSARNDGVWGNSETYLSSFVSWKFTIQHENAALRSDGDYIQNRW